MYKRIPNVCMNAFNNIIDIVIGFIISFYLLMIDFNSDKEIILKINNIITNYIKATFITSLIIFILSTIVFYIFGLDNAFILGIICGITNIIPYVGPYIGAALPVLLMFTKSIKKGILLSISIFIIQFIEGNIIGPLIIKKNIDIHPITSIIGLIIFSHFFGIVGAIIALPSIAIIKELYFYIKVLYN